MVYRTDWEKMVRTRAQFSRRRRESVVLVRSANKVRAAMASSTKNSRGRAKASEIQKREYTGDLREKQLDGDFERYYITAFFMHDSFIVNNTESKRNKDTNTKNSRNVEAKWDEVDHRPSE